MVNIVAYIREAWTYALLPAGAALGYYLDKWNDSKLMLYKNKSKLFQRELKPNEEAWK
ncbi:NADH dehydrogenase [ubiquinone] 1 beta subcomplex subunit 1 [Bufo gargarizans]|uniref:NADH dehydrogenase [ubiquinone] 1 beta subcomplex subunit 1 n=1 Tax=Bufo bufo TaxID=8384 RepID=UPI001ABE9485|nr:NADH dehydrogenase [ubiquinone] 1 beta subcomplex subunit 1 [Bufo bufo]XP_040268025.1 NADH dehydrogenase [ubiquinone] 1 beta subcomplex subunit 1 [Bufo bufo]XP_044127540.1 NADH dehydrogenase [ubiquinone] 1 beta subcomplex subunit 1 [Bufo gargarizans]XP_044127541.1 NADH dehydrogenase [ubiquinone] 1 beta subcomplex subunit 1 [Bufo gargarizans]XP_044127542.1 NADH dehydrogenase [ubiquinone] 1 beta subcomplex subunit 1 [Bufo gargarizans]